MFKKFIPFAHALNVFEIDPSFFVRNKIKNVFVDLDNTLDSYKAHVASRQVIELKQSLQMYDLNLIIISNNKDHRVKEYADSLGVSYLASTHKPFKKRLLAYMANNNLNIEESILVGDQLLTDVLLGHNTGLRVILTEKIVKEDQWTTKFNRLIDRPIRKYLKKKGKLVRWVNVHGKF